MYKSIYVLAAVLFEFSHCFSDIGKWDIPLRGESCLYTLAKSLFKESKVHIILHCDVAETTNVTAKIQWMPNSCSPDYMHYFEQEILQCPIREDITPYNTTNVMLVVQTHVCHGKESIVYHDDRLHTAFKKPNDDLTSQSKIPSFATVEMEGIYILRMSVRSSSQNNGSVRVEMISPHGYLSVAIWPLLPFYGIMCSVYTMLCTCWLVVCGLQWRDLLRIQYWIGAVALVGMVESATYYAVYSAINNSGYFNVNAYIFAEWMSIAKRALARMLVIIVSLGFGIVKPRLGPALQRVVGTGLIWGILAAINAWLRMHHNDMGNSNRDLLLSEVPLSLVDGAISWWVFVSLAHTMRTLQLRRNSIKLSLYRHFTNTLIFAVISSVIFMLYTIKTYRISQCIADWKDVWIDEAYWHILFACILCVIMVLWRPTNNNQRYAFTPLLDNAEDDDEEEEQFVNDAYGVKMRGSSLNNGDVDRESQPDNSLESDLRWVEENIPTSSLPLLDSDEEIINTKFEVSKMQ